MKEEDKPVTILTDEQRQEVPDYDRVKIVGRPRKFRSRKDLIDMINDYFTSRPKSEWRITGLALFLRINRETLYAWIREKREFSDIIKEACMAIEDKYAHNCEKRGNAGDIFILKNMGWVDKQEIVQKNMDIDTKDDEFINEVAKQVADLADTDD